MQEYVVEVEQGLNQKQLAEHLSVNRTKIDDIATTAGLEPLHGLYPWRRIFRHIHGTERSSLVAHLNTLRVRHGTALPHFNDLEAELRAPLLTFEEIAQMLGKKPDTLAKSLREGRDTLPFPTLVLGPRIRRYRPLEVMLWIDHGVALELPPVKADHRTKKSVPARKSEASASGSEKLANLSSGEAREGLTTAKESAKNALFGAFSSSKRISVR